MTFARLFFVCLVSISAYATRLPQIDDLAEKSQEAKQLMAEGKFQQAIVVYRELNEALPNNPGLKLNLGMALHLAGKKREAIPQLEEAVKLDPHMAPAWLFLGTTRLQLGEASAALKPLRTVLQLQPDQHQARQMLADALFSLDRLEEARTEYQRIATEDSQNATAWYGLGRCYELLSSTTFEKLQELAPESAYVLSLLAEARLREQQFSSAFYLYRRALERMPTLHGLHSALAEIYRQTGHPEWAEIEEQREMALAVLDCRSPTLECHFHAGKYEDLIAAAESANTPESLYWRTRAYNELALTAFDRLGRLPSSAELHELKGHIYNNQKKYSEAASEWRKALELSPTNLQIRKELAISLKLGEDYSAALPLFQELLHQQPDSAEFSGRAGGSVSDSRGDVIELIAQANFSSNAVAIAASARQFQYKPVIRVGANVLPEFGGLPQCTDYHVDFPIIIKIGESTATMGACQRKTCVRRYVAEGSIAEVGEKAVGLLVVG
jgi:tetratricopeptide (TPR) repeat protein